MDQPVPEDPNAPQRPDWLVGADEGAGAETARIDRREAAANSAPIRLIRPQAEGAPAPPAAAASADYGALELTGGEASPGTSDARESLSISRLAAKRVQAEKEKPPEKKVWAQAASSVPRLRLVPGTMKAPAGARPGPAPAPVAPPDEEGFLEDDAAPVSAGAGASTSAVSAGVRPRPVPVLREAWWVVALDAVRSDRKVQVLIVVVVAGVLAMMMLRPQEDAATSIRTLREQSDRFDGRLVTVAGRVGEVFPVGGGYSFYLHQGRDTLVVFTRTRRPEWHSRVKVKGTISTGFLDGVARQALFEEL